jgi:hypothetical protein
VALTIIILSNSLARHAQPSSSKYLLLHNSTQFVQDQTGLLDCILTENFHDHRAFLKIHFGVAWRGAESASVCRLLQRDRRYAGEASCLADDYPANLAGAVWGGK